MPSVKINTIDQSRYIKPAPDSAMVVLVPGTASFGPTFDDNSPSVVSFVGNEGLTNFYDTFGFGPAMIESGDYKKILDGDITFEYVTNLLSRGATVQFVRLNEGVKAETAEVGTLGAKLSARFSGRFGNYMWVKASLVPDSVSSTGFSTTDIVFTVARKSNRANESVESDTTMTLDGFNKLTTLESLRVSTNPSSPFYGNRNAFSYIDNITDQTIEAFIGAIVENISGETFYVQVPQAPTNWSKTYSSYYVRTGSAGSYTYTNISSVAPTWAEDTYYTRSGSEGAYTYTLQEEAPSSWSTTFGNYFTKNATKDEYYPVVGNAPEFSGIEGGVWKKNPAAIIPYGIYNLFGGKDFETDEQATELENILDKLGGDNNIYTNFVDPYLFDFDFVTSGGWCSTFSISMPWTAVDAVHLAMIALCENRGDCTALLDTPKSMTAKEVSAYSSYINTDSATIYAPWCEIISNSTGNSIEFAPSAVFMFAILNGMNNSVNNELWYVPAGVTRASAPFVISPKYEIGSVTLDLFQNSNKFRVNPIMKVRNYGYCVYGNSTCLQSIEGKSNSVLESMNVKLLCNAIKKAIFAICSSLAFEYNDTRLWAKFYGLMDKVLVYMKRNYGLYDYKIIMDGSTVDSLAMNERRVPGKIKVSPTLAGEFFDIDFELSPSGVTFSEEA